MRRREGCWSLRAVMPCALGVVLAMGAAPAGAQIATISERPCTAFWNAAAVFSGQIDSIQRTPSGRRVWLTLVERFHPTPDVRDFGPQTMALNLPPSSPCAARLRVGTEYLFYADRDGAGLSLARCSRTREIDDAGADVDYARSVLDGSAPAGTINGRVLVSNRDLAGRIAGPAAPAVDVAVRMSAGGQQDQTTTNQAGDFTFASRGAGAHTLAVDVSQRFYSESTTAAIVLRDPHACADVEFRLAPDGQLSGRVVDSDRRPLAGLTVEVSTLTLAQKRVAVTDRDGRYELTRMPAGRFVVGVASNAQGRGGKPLRVFLPGVTAVAAATRVIVGEGERIAAPDFRLPASVKYVGISGFVLDPDGRPAEGAQVYVKGASEGERIVGEPVPADFVGRFTVAVPSGRDYVVFAERKRGTRVDSSDQIVVSPDAAKPIRLTLQRRY